MNIVKKMAIAAVICAAVANAQDISFGARVGYSMQSLDGGTLFTPIISPTTTDVNMGLFGVGAAVIIQIPVGPVTIAPEVGFLARTLASTETKTNTMEGLGLENQIGTVSEFAVSVPIMVRYFPIEGLYVAVGFQLDIPIGTEACDDTGEKCEKYDGEKEPLTYQNTAGEIENSENQHPERAALDMGIPIGVGYMLMPNLGVDLRFVLGLNNILKRDTGIPMLGTLESGKMHAFSLGVSYYF